MARITVADVFKAFQTARRERAKAIERKEGYGAAHIATVSLERFLMNCDTQLKLPKEVKAAVLSLSRP